MRVVSGRWFLASLAWVCMWMAMAGWAQAQPLPPASFGVDIAPGVRGRIDIGMPPPPVWMLKVTGFPPLWIAETERRKR